MSSKISGGSLVAKCLRFEDVEYVFSISGGHINPIYKGLVEEGIKIIIMRHEQAAGNAAEGQAKTTLNPSVCLVTAGPGFSNVISALISAYYAHNPVICITGHTTLRDINKHAAQEVDHLPIAISITKYANIYGLGLRSITTNGLGLRLPITKIFEIVDLMGLDTVVNVLSYLYPTLDNSSAPPTLLKEMIKEDKLGIKSGKGFHDYSNEDLKVIMNQKQAATFQLLMLMQQYD